MRSPRQSALPIAAICALAASLFVASPSRADEVLLKNGATFEGKILSEDKTRIILRTTAGAKLTLPRNEIAKVTRKAVSEGAELFAAGRRALKRGERESALQFFREAAASGDPSAVRAAKEELRRLERGEDLPPGEGSGRRIPFENGKDPFDPPEPEAILRELEAAAKQGDEGARQRWVSRLYQRAREHEGAKRYLEAAVDYQRASANAKGLFGKDFTQPWFEAAALNRLRVAREAIRRRNARLALAAAGPVLESKLTPRNLLPSAAYFQGRALELANRRGLAIKAYATTFGDVEPSRQDVETYRELARLTTVGIKVGPGSPGVGRDWQRVETRHFSILHQLQKSDPGLGSRFEAWRDAAYKRLQLKNLPPKDRIQVFLYRDREAYLQSEGARSWSAGHATRLQAAHDENEVLRVMYFFPSQNDASTARHEIAHILTWDSLGDKAELPLWAVEGAAIYAEPDNVRMWRRRRAGQWRTGLEPTRTALARMLFPVTKTDQDVGRFYVQSGVNFAVLADRVGVAKAFQVALGINTKGPRLALRSAGLDLRSFEADVERAIGGALPKAPAQKKTQ